MSTFVLRLPGSGTGLRLAVKDLVDVAGLPTTAGTRARADAPPADSDAACLAGIRAAERAGELRLVGKTNLDELAYGIRGVNEWFGTPPNPLDPRLVPGGSSSGSAAALGSGEADLALGTDTGGSIRIPAACCGVAGLKPTWGRVPMAGVWPLSPSLDTVGPMARDIAGLVTGWALLDPSFEGLPSNGSLPGGTARVGRLHTDADPRIDAAVDAALSAAGLAVVDVTVPGWRKAAGAADVVLTVEAWRAHRELLERPELLEARTAHNLADGATVGAAAEAVAREQLAGWRRELSEVFRQVDLLALPTLTGFPVDIGARFSAWHDTVPVNAAGVPALALPVPTGGPLPASLQLVGPPGSEPLLLAVGAQVEAAVGAATG